MKNRKAGQREKERTGSVQKRTGKKQEKKRPEKKKIEKQKLALYTVLAIVLVVAIGAVAFVTVKAVGKASLKKNAQVSAAALLNDTEAGSGEAGVIYRNGQKYRYNEDLYTILCIGVDSREETLEEGGEMGDGGQADALFLLVVDEKNQKMSVIAIPRDTMTDVDVYDVFGQYYDTMREQIALQYAFGDGGSISCELTQKAVSNLMYQLPIHAYVAINMNAIGVINDAVGGVTLEVLEDLEEDYGSLHKKGETVTLMGTEARLYVQGRNEEEDFSAMNRLARQKQYLLAFAGQLIQATKQDVTLPVRVYNSVTDYMITDVTASEVAYLASVAVNCSFSEEDFHMIAGEQVKGAVYEEYEVDEEALSELILQTFYLPVEEN